MSAEKHTEGPWSVLEHEGEVFVLANGAQQIAAVTYVLERAGEQGSRRLQNARMMAAALELLELAAEAAALQKAHYGDGMGLHIAMIDWAAKAAPILAKATGSTS